MPRRRTASPGPTSTDLEDTPERIRRAAVELFREFGYHGTSVRALADAVGIEPASLYHHFDSKQTVLVDFFDRTMDELVEGIRHALESDASHRQRLRDAIRFHVLYHVERQAEAFLSRSELRSLTPENRTRIYTKRDRYEHAMRTFLRTGVEAGEFEIDDIELTATAILVMCSGVSEWFADRGRLSGEQVAEKYAEIALTLVCGRGRSHAPAG